MQKKSDLTEEETAELSERVAEELEDMATIEKNINQRAEDSLRAWTETTIKEIRTV